MYFANFPIIPYDSVGNGEFKLVTNLLKRVAVRSKVKTNVMLFDTYDVKEGETPEILADILYGDAELHWVILLMNNVTDRYHQWPMNNNQFLSYMYDKYTNQDAVHHYEISQVSGDTTIKINIGSPIHYREYATLGIEGLSSLVEQKLKYLSGELNEN